VQCCKRTASVLSVGTLAELPHADVADAWVRVISGVCDFVRVFVCLSVGVRALKGKWRELSLPNLVHIYSTAGSRHALIRRSEGQRSRSHGYGNRDGRMAASGCCGRCAAAAAGVGLHVV